MPTADATRRAQVLWSSYLTGDTTGVEPRIRMIRKVFAPLPSQPRSRV